MPIEDHNIDLAHAAQMTARFRNANPPTVIIAHKFDVGIIQQIINQPGCTGIRIYNAIDDNNDATLVVTGVDAMDNDMFNDTLAEHTIKCPSICPPFNPLNS